MANNITGNPVVNDDFLATRLYLVEDLKILLQESSVIIESPRRFGKTSIIKEFFRQESVKKKKDQEFNTLYLELEGEEHINDFCRKLFKELLKLYWVLEHVNVVRNFLGGLWNTLASLIKKVKILEFELELNKITKDYGFSDWKEKINPLILGLNSFDKKTVIVFDEFPDMLLNFKKTAETEADFKNTTDRLLAWLRSLRQIQEQGCKYRFVFCGSISLRKTIEDIDMIKRINDLDTFEIPPMSCDDAKCLIDSMSKEYKLKIDSQAQAFLISKITNSSPYHAQVLIKVLREQKRKEFNLGEVIEIYESLVLGGSHELVHYHSRLGSDSSPSEKGYLTAILRHLCHGSRTEKELHGLLFKESPYEQFQSAVNRLIYEGYIIRDIGHKGNLKFVSQMLRDWWAFKYGGEANVRI